MSRTSDPAPPDVPDAEQRPRRRRLLAWTAAGLILVLAAGTGGYLLLRPSGSGGDSPTTASDATTARVARQTLTAQTQVNGTLGYGGAGDVVIPTGTAADALRQAEDAVSTAQTTLTGDRTAVGDTARSGRQTVAAAATAVRSAEAAVSSAAAAKQRSCSAGASPECTQAKQQLGDARGQLTQANASLASAKTQATAADNQASARVDADRSALASAQAALADARSRATNAGLTYTAVAAVGTTVKRGQLLYAVDGATVPLFYGSVVPWRALYLGVAPGADVAALDDNLAALGYGSSLAGRRDFTDATRRAVEAWRKDVGAEPTGTVALGDVVYRPGAVVVTAATAAAGQAAQPGAAVLTASSTTRTVTVALDAGQQGQVEAGDKVTVTLPDGSTVPATVTSVGTVATSSGSDGSGDGGGAATISVLISLTHPKAAAGLDQAPVLVGITTATVEDAIVVPVNALLALAGGGYGVEVVNADGTHRLTAVTPGTFDDAKGLVQVTDTDLQAGQRVVVPSS